MEYALDELKGESGTSPNGRPTRVACLFGTRPEVIKFAPVIRALEAEGAETLIICSSQHTDLILPLIKQFGIRIDHNLKVMRPNQTLDGICARVMEGLAPILECESPDALLVQGDTTTAMAGALTAFHARIPVGHIEAGLRSGNRDSPFPEEINRRLITRIASYHFAATERNVNALTAEGVHPESIFQTGNPVIDSLLTTLEKPTVGGELKKVLMASADTKRIVLTTHRRESLGDKMRGHLLAIRDFVRQHQDTSLIFPVHPNPHVMKCAQDILGNESRVWMTSPLPYHEFSALLKTSWLIFGLWCQEIALAPISKNNIPPFYTTKKVS